jgi:uncharacterized protein YjbJ (UPF0337 family)
MGDRVDEMTGNVKEAAGKVTGNQQQEAEGRAEAEAARVRREGSAMQDDVTGNIKEGVGKVTGDQDLQAQGAWDKTKADIKRI